MCRLTRYTKLAQTSVSRKKYDTEYAVYIVPTQESTLVLFACILSMQELYEEYSRVSPQDQCLKITTINSTH
ncbi:MAG: hypothetical protein NVS4B11_32220 [Ktedonobacteraceae bacterium]